MKNQRVLLHALGGMTLLLACTAGCGDARTGSKTGSKPREFDVGAMPQGTCLEIFVPVDNPAMSPLKITAWESSCKCLAITPATLEIPANVVGYAKVSLDFDHAPSFSGDLRIQCRGRGVDGTEIARFVVLVSVVDANTLAAAL